MNYAELAATLHHVGDRLSKYAGKIEGESMGQSARVLLTHLSKFEALLDGYIASRKSGELLLETLLQSPAAKRHLTIDLLRAGLRRLTGKRLRSTDLRAAKKEFVERIHEAGSQDEASEFLQDAFAESIHVDSGGKDKASLQREFVGLGRLAEEEFAQEMQRKSLGELRRLAETNGIRFTDKTSKQRLAALVRRYAQRAVLNIWVAA